MGHIGRRRRPRAQQLHPLPQQIEVRGDVIYLVGLHRARLHCQCPVQNVDGARRDIAVRHRELVKFALVGAIAYVADITLLKMTVLEPRPDHHQDHRGAGGGAVAQFERWRDSS